MAKGALSLRTKVFLALLLVYLPTVTLFSYLAYRQAVSSAFSEARGRMEALLQSGVAVRKLVAQDMRSKLLPLVIKGEDLPLFGLSSTVAFAHWARFLKDSLPDYTLRVFAPNPLNPNHLPQAWEKPLLEEARRMEKAFERKVRIPTQVQVREGDERKGAVAVRTETRPLPHLATLIPVRVEGECLLCHRSPASAPALVRASYPGPSGYGWKAGDLAGVLMVTVPVGQVQAVATRQALGMASGITVFFLLTALAIYALLNRLVLGPVGFLTERVEALSQGEGLDEPLPDFPRDEVGRLARAVELLRRSIKLLSE